MSILLLCREADYTLHLDLKELGYTVGIARSAREAARPTAFALSHHTGLVGTLMKREGGKSVIGGQ